MLKKNFITLFMVALLAPIAHASAESKGGVELKSIAEVEVVVIDENGKEEIRRIDASEANVTPGETVIFTTFYTNNGDKSATGLAIKNPVPKDMVYVDETAGGEGAVVDFSVDGGKTYGPPDSLKITDPDGKQIPATASDYTHIRWSLSAPLDPGAQGNVFFRAKVK